MPGVSFISVTSNEILDRSLSKKIANIIQKRRAGPVLVNMFFSV